MRSPRRSSLWTLVPFLVCAVCAVGLARSAAAQDKIPVKSADDLPRHTYKIAGSVTDVLKSDEQCAALAKQVRADIEADLAKYQIDDPSTLQKYYNVLLSLDLLDGRYDAVLKGVAKLRELESKEAKKLTTGLAAEAMVAARKTAGEDDAKFRATFKANFAEKVGKLPWDIVANEIEQRKGQAEIISEDLLMGMVQSSLDPAVAKLNGEIGADIAQQITSMRYALKVAIPLKAEVVEVYKGAIDAHKVAKKDIWEARAVTLKDDQKLTPVVVAIWDSGVDTKIFEKQLWADAKKPELHGLAFDIDSNPSPDLLHPLTALNGKPDEVVKYMKGFMDVQSAIDSPEAADVKKVMAGLKGEEVKKFIEDLGLFGNYAHGTHVSGIATDGNPFIRLLVGRITFDYHMMPICPTLERSRKSAAAEQTMVDYFKQNGVRLANMSWGGDRKSIESDLEKNGIGETAEKRAAMAREMYKIERDGLYEALKSAPDILFVTAAGNADNDVEFDEVIPSGFDLPNLLVVGAVDQSGAPTNFTSFGKTVQVYANGFEVESYIPGGKRLKFSGTSMASPNVANLAAKLLAIDPSLKPAQVIDLIKKGADKVEGKKPMLLINPQKTVELLKK
jgi:hypothetical protein